MSDFTPMQITALRWMRDFPSTRAEWCKDGKRTRLGHKHWNTMKLEGPRGSIVIPLADWKALHGFFIGCPTGDKIYGPSEAGLSVLDGEPNGKGKQPT